MGTYYDPASQHSHHVSFEYGSQLPRTVLKPQPSNSALTHFDYTYASGSIGKPTELPHEELSRQAMWPLLDHRSAPDQGGSGGNALEDLEEAALAWYTEGVWEVDQRMQVPQREVTFSLTEDSL